MVVGDHYSGDVCSDRHVFASGSCPAGTLLSLALVESTILERLHQVHVTPVNARGPDRQVIRASAKAVATLRAGSEFETESAERSTSIKQLQ
jgi:hypothetical protein